MMTSRKYQHQPIQKEETRRSHRFGMQRPKFAKSRFRPFLEIFFDDDLEFTPGSQRATIGISSWLARFHEGSPAWRLISTSRHTREFVLSPSQQTSLTSSSADSNYHLHPRSSVLAARIDDCKHATEKELAWIEIWSGSGTLFEFL